MQRLAGANHLKHAELRRYLTDPQARCVLQQKWLATASGQPLALLRARLIGLADADNHPTRQRRHARPACRLCMARKGVTEPVFCWFPDHVTVCRRHHRWIGPGNRALADQRDLHNAPAVLLAARRHARLHHNHGDATRCAFSDAARILRWWTATPPQTFSPTTACVDTYIDGYPDLVDLASILAEVRCQIFDTRSSTVKRCHIIDSLYSLLAVRFPGHRDKPRPVEQWVHDQQIIASGLHRPPGLPTRSLAVIPATVT